MNKLQSSLPFVFLSVPEKFPEFFGNFSPGTFSKIFQRLVSGDSEFQETTAKTKEEEEEDGGKYGGTNVRKS